jgi:hypothetical protein
MAYSSLRIVYYGYLRVMPTAPPVLCQISPCLFSHTRLTVTWLGFFCKMVVKVTHFTRFVSLLIIRIPFFKVSLPYSLTVTPSSLLSDFLRWSDQYAPKDCKQF